MALQDQYPDRNREVEDTYSLPYSRPIRFRHVADILRKDLPDLWSITDQIDECTILTTLISRHRANPQGIGPSLRYDIWQQNPRCRFPQLYLYEPDDRSRRSSPDLVIRDFSAANAVTDGSWQISVWGSGDNQDKPHAIVSEGTQGNLTLEDIGSLSIGIRMALNQSMDVS